MIDTAKWIIAVCDEACEKEEHVDGIVISTKEYKTYMRPVLQYFVDIMTPTPPVRAGCLWHCARCRAPIYEIGMAYCARCGQRLKGDDEEDD